MPTAPPRLGLVALVALVSAGIGSAVTLAVRSAAATDHASAARATLQPSHEVEALRAALEQLRARLDALPQELQTALASLPAREPASATRAPLGAEAMTELDALVARLERAASASIAPAAIRGRAVRARLDAQPQPNLQALRSLIGRESSDLMRELAFLDLEASIERFGTPTYIGMHEGSVQLLYTVDDSATGGRRNEIALYFVEGLLVRTSAH